MTILLSLSRFFTKSNKTNEPVVDHIGLRRMRELRSEHSLDAELLDLGMCKTVDDMDLQRRVLKGAHHHD